MEQDNYNYSERDVDMMHRFETGGEHDPDRKKKKKKRGEVFPVSEGSEAKAEKSAEKDKHNDDRDDKKHEKQEYQKELPAEPKAETATTTATETEQNQTELSQEEYDEAFRRIVEAETAANAEELQHVEPQTIEQAQALAEAKLLAAMDELSPEEAFDQTASEIEATAKQPEDDNEQNHEPQLEVSPSNFVDQSEAPPPEPDAHTPPNFPPVPPPPAPPRNPNTGGNPQPNLPPNPNVPQVSGPNQNHRINPIRYGMNYGGGGSWNNPNFSGNANPPNTNNNPNAVTTNKTEVYDYRRRRRGSDLLLGGIVGYLVGKRRGRINTEERLLPVQANLEKQVRGLQDRVYGQEAKIRNLAAEKYSQQFDQSNREKLITKLETLIRPNAEARRPESENLAHSQTEQFADRANEAIAANRVHYRQPERLGRALVISATAAEIAGRVAPEAMPSSLQEKLPPHIERMSDDSLMQVAETIKIDGNSVKDLYERDRLDKHGVQRMVAEYLRGGSVEQLLPYVVIGEEKMTERSHERKREEPAGSMVGGGAVAGQAAVQASLGQASVQAARKQSQAGLPQAQLPGPIIKENGKKSRQALTAVAISTAVIAGIAFFIFLLT